MKQRRAHVLKPTVGRERPGNIIFFDTETRQQLQANGDTVHSLRLGYAVHYRRFKKRGYVQQDALTFANMDTFISWVNSRCRKKSTTYLVAHNIVFDLSIVHAYTELARQGWKLQSFYSKATTSIFRWQDQERRLVGMDNMNLFQGKLERWGQIFGYPKGSVDFDNVSDHDLLVYCMRDVEIMVKSWLSWLQFLDDHDLGNFKITTAATSLSAWRHRFMGDRVHIHDIADALVLEREAYHGGRAECFWAGSRSDGPFYYVDVNNMYGYVLSRFEYPAGIWNVDSHADLSRLLRKLDKQAVVARVLIETSQPVFPVLRDNRTTYPVGQFVTTLTTPELILAISSGWLLDVYSMAWYRSAPLFRDYMLYCHDLRMKYRAEGNAGYEQIAKMLMNALYGKFGQSGFDQRRIGDTDPDKTWSQLVLDAQTGAVYRMFALGGGVYEERKTGESANSFPAIAAHVTAYARLYLWELMTLAGRSHVFYCDTDSMIVDQAGRDNISDLLDPHRMGFMKVEHTSSSLTIHAPKDYSMDDRVRVKGLSKSAEYLSENSVSQDQWQRLAGQIRAGSTDDFIVRRVRKNLARTIQSGVLTATGWIDPFVLQADPVKLASAAQRHLSALLQSRG